MEGQSQIVLVGVSQAPGAQPAIPFSLISFA